MCDKASRAGGWDIEFYADEQGREPCRQWAAVRLVLARRGLDVVGSEYGKALGDGLYEFRVRWSAAEITRKIEGLPAGEVGAAPEDILLRVFFCTAGRKIVLLLNGYDKAQRPGDRWQQREITRARKLLTACREAQKRARKRP